VLPRQTSLNVSGSIPPKGGVRQRLILCAHLDTHRTPVFYSSRRWYALFGFLVSLTFLSMVAGTLIYGTAVLLAWSGLRWASLALIPIQAFSLIVCLHADFTPYTPGANDDASGVAAIITLAKRLARNQLESTEVHLVFTGCEEVGAWGMAAYLDRYAKQLGPEAIYVILDEVGLGTLKYLTSDGLLFKHKTHQRALEIARSTAQALPGIKVMEGPGVAYTDALQATKRGLISLTLCAVPTPESGLESHWHRMSDTLENMRVEDLEKTLAFVWALLQQVDRPAETTPQPLNG
jgi:hypothetical protein